MTDFDGRTIGRVSDGHRPAGPTRPSPLLDERVASIDIYELERVDLSPLHGLVVGTNIDQEHLYRHRKVIEAFLDAGKMLVFSGHLSQPWLPGAGMFVARPIHHHQDYALTVVQPAHPVFEGVEDADITYQRGVSGFFSRGHNPPLGQVTPVVTLPGGEPAVYEDRSSTRGVILVHAGNDMIGFGNMAASPTTAARITPQLLDWIERTYAEVRSAGKVLA
jgi:hypothetical protein